MPPVVALELRASPVLQEPEGQLVVSQVVPEAEAFAALEAREQPALEVLVVQLEPPQERQVAVVVLRD